MRKGVNVLLCSFIAFFPLKFCVVFHLDVKFRIHVDLQVPLHVPVPIFDNCFIAPL